MPHFNTHLKFVNNLKKLNINKDYLKSGAIFPDIGDFVNLSKHKDLSAFLHFPEPKSKKGLLLSKNLIKNAKTKKELSFAIGFYSHFFLDSTVHKYFKDKNLNLDKHLIIEYFKAYLDLNYTIKKLYFPREFFLKVFKKTFKKEKKLEEYLSQIRSIGKTKLFIYSLKVNAYSNNLIKKGYGGKRKKLFLLRIIFLFQKRIYLKRYNINIFNYLNPSQELKKKHLENINEIILKAQKDFLKEIKILKRI